MQKMNNRFDRWIFESYTSTPEGLGLLRMFTALFILFFLVPGQGTQHFAYLAGMPDEFYTPPPGPLLLLDGFPPLVLFRFLHTLLLVSLVAMLAGYRTKLASILAGASILLLQGFIYSVGKVNHEIVIAAVPIIMAFSNWGAAFSVDSARQKSSRQVHSWPFTLIALLVGFMMFTAAFPKILGGWLDPSTQAVQGHLFNLYFARGRDALLAEWFLNFDSTVFWELLDWVTILFEAGFFLAVVRSAWFKRFICIAVLFHFGTMLMLNIAFMPNFLAYALFLNWGNIYEKTLWFYRKVTGKRGEKSGIRSAWLLSFVGLMTFSILSYISSKNLVLTGSDLMLHEVVIVTAGVMIVAALLVRLFTHHQRALEK